MKAHDFIKAWGGEQLLLALSCFKLLSSIPGLRYIYHVLLIRLVENTGLFDETFYRENNPDIAEAGVGGLSHYVVYGDKEGRSPMPFFDPHYYRQMSVRWTMNLNALLHYSYVGRFRRISPSPWFDVKYYLTQNKDVARAGLDPIVHYMEWGGIEGRWPCPHFDSAYYLQSNPDVCDLNINPLLHYLRYGRSEGRRCLPESTDNNGVLMVGERPKPVLPSEAEWSALVPRSPNSEAAVDVVVPVYRGLAETLRCIYSVLSATCDVEYQLVVINDASPEDELVEALERLAEKGLFTLVSNDDNLGFVRTANSGMQLHSRRDVVLLNSDTEVYDRWLDRLSVAAKRNAQTGTITPLSNNATICSYPHFPEENPFPLELDYAELDGMIGELNAGFEVEAPTGVGFCMYIKRQCIKDVGLFDEKAFGKGYGEENDFCQRAIKKGWRNVIATDVFVRHYGSVSFQGEKAKLSEHSLRVIGKKHKNYLRDVAAFIRQRPLADIYRRIDMARLLRMRREKNVLLVSHGRGGGTERYLQESAGQLLQHGHGVFVMRPLHNEPMKVTIGHQAIRELPNIPALSLRDADSLKWLLRELGIDQAHIHSLVDYSAEAPLALRNLLRSMGIGFKVHIHDYEVVCPRINLVDDDGCYCGEPGESGCHRCLAGIGSDFAVQDIAAWRRQHESLLMAADKVIVPDQDVADRLSGYFTKLKCEVKAHDDADNMRRRGHQSVIGSQEKLRVVVIGAVSKMKGYEVLRNCARDARRRRLAIEYYLLGYSLDDKLLEAEGVNVVGKYLDSEALKRLEKLDPHAVLLPSIAPETYSYTLSLAFQAGYPIFAFDIGAIARRLRAQGLQGGLMPFELHKDENRINDFLLRYRNSVLEYDSEADMDSEEFEASVVAVYD